MTRKVKELRDLEIDEISLVDKGANQHAMTVIAKRDDEEDVMDFYDENGNIIDDVDSLEPDTVVYDKAGNAFVATVEDDDEDEFVDEREEEPVLVGKSFTSADFREALSKALTDEDRDEVYARMVDQMGEYEQVAKAAAMQAETERQMRLDREYTEIAKNYSVGVEPEVLGPVLKRLAESMSREDNLVIKRALDSATALAEDVFIEKGYQGAGANNDVWNQVEGYIDSQVSKGEGSREDMVSKVFEMNPEAYDDYLREQANR